MRTYYSLKLLILHLIWLLLSVFPATSMATYDAPESVTIDYLQELYTEVNFDHQMHSDMYSCSACHHHTTGTSAQNKNCKKCHTSPAAPEDVSCSGCHKAAPDSAAVRKDTPDGTIYHIDKPGLKGALHQQCVGCHRSEDGPTGCMECHEFTPAGRKRFAIKD